MTKIDQSKSHLPPSGCLYFITIYFILLIGSYLISTQSMETKEITGSVASKFFVAGYVKTFSSQQPEYKIFSLETLRSGNVDLSAISFLLPEESIAINVGDIHGVEVIEDHGGRLEFERSQQPAL